MADFRIQAYHDGNAVLSTWIRDATDENDARKQFWDLYAAKQSMEAETGCPWHTDNDQVAHIQECRRDPDYSPDAGWHDRLRPLMPSLEDAPTKVRLAISTCAEFDAQERADKLRELLAAEFDRGYQAACDNLSREAALRERSRLKISDVALAALICVLVPPSF